MLQSIVIRNCEYFTMLITATLIRRGSLYSYMAGRCAQPPLWPLATYCLIILRETICSALLPAITNANLAFCARTSKGMHVCPISLSISPAIFSPNFFWCAHVHSVQVGGQLTEIILCNKQTVQGRGSPSMALLTTKSHNLVQLQAPNVILAGNH